MTQVHFLDWTFLVDKNLTQDIYSSTDKGGADECDCSMCKNYVARRHKIFDLLLREFFKNVGVNFSKEYEVYHMGKETNGLHLYGTWFNFAGQILDGPNCKVQTTDGKFIIEHHDLNSNLSIAFLPTSKPSESFFDKIEKVVQVDFLFTISWIVSDEEPE